MHVWHQQVRMSVTLKHEVRNCKRVRLILIAAPFSPKKTASALAGVITHRPRVIMKSYRPLGLWPDGCM